MSELRPDCQVAPDVTLRADEVDPPLNPIAAGSFERLDALYGAALEQFRGRIRSGDYPKYPRMNER